MTEVKPTVSAQLATLAAVLEGRYRIVRELGRGGMGCVYLAEDLRHERDVAIKVLSVEDTNLAATERFTREIAVVARLSHPHIVPLIDSGHGSGLHWFVMPRIEGASLRERLDTERQLDIDDAVRISIEVAKALVTAHAHGVLHRDIKPENVLLSSGSAVVTDFGIAKLMTDEPEEARLTQTGYAIGSAAYMSPEQATGIEAVDERSDVYGLGCMLYEMLTGEPPFIGRTVQSVLAKRFTDPVPLASRLRDVVSPELDAVIQCAMARAPQDRYRTMHDFEVALAAATRRVGTTSAPARTASVPAAPVPAQPRSRRTALLAGAAVLVTIAVLGVLRATGLVGKGRSITSVAVRPLTDISAARNQEYFSAGLTDELLTALSGIDGLRVAARSSSYAFKAKAQDLRDFGTQLGVDAVLDGTVQKEGNRVRVSVELVTVKDGFSVWKRSYDGDVSDIFTMQETVARAIVTAVGIQLGDGTAPIVKRSTDDVDAYQLYMKGRLALDRRSAASLIEARRWFEQAVARDSGYARAWSGLADVAFIQGMNVFVAPGEAFPRAKAAVRRALALDSTSVEAQTSNANVLFFHDRDFARADTAFRRAIAIDGRYPQARYWHGLFLAVRHKPDSALAEVRLAASLDPFSPPISTSVGMVLVLSGRFADAVRPLRDAIAVTPEYYFAHAWLSLALAETGANEEAVREARRGVELAPDAMLASGYLAYVLARTGARDAAVAQFARLDSLSQTRSVAAVWVARAWDAMGDAGRTFQWLERGIKEGDGQLAQLGMAPAFRTVATDARFTRLLEQLKIP